MHNKCTKNVVDNKFKLFFEVLCQLSIKTLWASKNVLNIE